MYSALNAKRELRYTAAVVLSVELDRLAMLPATTAAAKSGSELYVCELGTWCLELKDWRLRVESASTYWKALSLACSARRYLSWSSSERPCSPISSRVFLGFWRVSWS